jgi:hypothetical protein
MRLASLLAILTTSVSLATAGDAVTHRDSSACRAEGLFFELRAVPLYEASPSVMERGELVMLGPGYALSRVWALSLLFATGSRVVAPSAARPVNGEFALGGARLELTYFLSDKGSIRPFCSAGAGLFSIINVGGLGYNGNGIHVGAGVGWEPTDFFRGKLGVEYDRMRFFNLVNQPEGQFEPFALNALGVSLSASFVPGIVP